MLLATPPKMKGQSANSYPQTPVLKGREAVSHAVSSMGTCLFAAGRVVLGVMCFVSPNNAATTYGLASAAGWVQANGARDIFLGVATMGLHMTHRASLRIFLPISAMIPLGDAYVVATFGDVGGVRSGQCMMHLFAAALVLFLAACVWSDPLVMPRMVLGRPVSDFSV